MEIRSYQPGDETAILKLFKAAFKRPMPLEYWNWRYRDNPTLERPLIYLVWVNNEAVAHYAVSPVKLLKSGEEVLGALSMTTMTHPEHEGRGYFRTLASQLYQQARDDLGMSIIYGFPNNLSHRGFIQGLQWQDVEVIPMLALDWQALRRKPDLATFQRVGSFDPEMIDCYDKITNDFDFRLCRSAEFLTWRLLRNPNSSYVALKDIATGAFVVFKQYDDGTSLNIDIVEWAVPNDLSLSEQALASIAAEISRPDLHRFCLWMPLTDPRHLTLEKLGFQLDKPLTYLGYRDSEHLTTTASPTRWYYQMSDSDVF